MKYKVKFYSGYYSNRQKAANNDKAICYYEQHLNSAGADAVGIEVLICNNASTTSIKWAVALANNYYSVLQTRLRHGNGVVELDKKNRGYGNLVSTTMPAILGEPLFVSNPNEVALLVSDKMLGKLGKAVADSIIHMFPDGGLVALSIGHKGKPKSADMGADVVGQSKMEADYAEDILVYAKGYLETAT